MTTQEFLKTAEDYFGRWQRVTVRASVMQFLHLRNDAYRDELWNLLRDSRAASYGPPDMKALVDLHGEVCDRLQLQAASLRPAHLLEDGEPLCTAKEVGEFWRNLNDQFSEKWELDKKAHHNAPPRYTRTERAFSNLDDVRGDEPITLPRHDP